MLNRTQGKCYLQKAFDFIVSIALIAVISSMISACSDPEDTIDNPVTVDKTAPTPTLVNSYPLKQGQVVQIRFGEFVIENSLSITMTPIASSSVTIVEGGVRNQTFKVAFSGQSVSFEPPQIEDNVTYTITVKEGLSDQSGNVTTKDFPFNINSPRPPGGNGDTEPPSINLAASTPQPIETDANNKIHYDAKFQIQFSELLEPTTVNTDNLVMKLKDANTIVEVNNLQLSTKAIGNNVSVSVVSIEPTSLLQFGKEYTIAFSGIKDLVSNEMPPELLTYSVFPDSDGDKMPDWWEAIYGQDIIPGDMDGDTLSGVEEFKYNTNPLKADTDGDGVDDGAEIVAGTDPNVNIAAVYLVISGKRQ